MKQKTESILSSERSMRELANTGGLLLNKTCLEKAIYTMVEQAVESTRSDLGAYYSLDNTAKRNSNLKLRYQKFRRPLPGLISVKSDIVTFITDCRDTILYLSKEESPEDSFMREVLLHTSMKSGAAMPILLKESLAGILFVNSKQDNYYNRNKFRFLENLSRLSTGFLEKCENEEGEKK